MNKLKRLLSIRPVKITHTKGEWSKSTVVWLYYDDPLRVIIRKHREGVKNG